MRSTRTCHQSPPSIRAGRRSFLRSKPPTCLACRSAQRCTTLVCTATHLSCQLSDVRLRQALVQFQHVGKAASIHVLHDDRDGTIIKKCLREGKGVMTVTT